MTRVSPPLACFLATACFLGGCLAPGSSIVVRSTGGTEGPTNYEVRQESPELANVVRVVHAAARNAGGERVAQIDVENTTKQPVTLEYQFRWRDRFGSELATLWEWRDIVLQPGQTRRLEDEAVDSEWVHYTCELRKKN